MGDNQSKIKILCLRGDNESSRNFERNLINILGESESIEYHELDPVLCGDETDEPCQTKIIAIGKPEDFEDIEEDWRWAEDACDIAITNGEQIDVNTIEPITSGLLVFDEDGLVAKNWFSESFDLVGKTADEAASEYADLAGGAQIGVDGDAWYFNIC